MNIGELYRHRFYKKQDAKSAFWREICIFLQQFIPQNASILDLAAGYGEFINQIKTSGGKIAVDVNEDTRHHVSDDVEFVLSKATELAKT